MKDRFAKPLVIAHRGARAFAPENTLEAFEKAAKLGADTVELDVQLTADDQLIVVHDGTLERCSNVRQVFADRVDYRVRSFSLSEIESLDAGSWFVHETERAPAERQAFLRSLSLDEARRFVAPSDRSHYVSGRVRHPTLSSALERIRQLDLLVNVELKASEENAVGNRSGAAPVNAAAARPLVPDSLTDRTVRLIDELGMCDRVMISSFDHASLRRVKRIQPAIATGVLVVRPLADPVAYCRDLAASAYHPGCAGDHDSVGFESEEYCATGRLPAEPFRSLRRAGLAVNVWTENDPERMKVLIAAGATGIFTDYPNRLVDLLRQGVRCPDFEIGP